MFRRELREQLHQPLVKVNLAKCVCDIRLLTCSVCLLFQYFCEYAFVSERFFLEFIGYLITQTSGLDRNHFFVVHFSGFFTCVSSFRLTSTSAIAEFVQLVRPIDIVVGGVEPRWGDFVRAHTFCDEGGFHCQCAHLNSIDISRNIIICIDGINFDYLN